MPSEPARSAVAIVKPLVLSFSAFRYDLKRVYWNLSKVFRFPFASHNLIDSLQSAGGEEDLTTLGTNFCWNVTQNIEVTFPSVDMLNTSFFNQAFAKSAMPHVY
jgi:hypothetical protein